MTLTFKTIRGSEKAAHQHALDGDKIVGEVWREQVSVVVSKLTEPRRMGKKWRWFAKKAGSTETLGRGTRAALLLGPGFKSKVDAAAVLETQE